MSGFLNPIVEINSLDSGILISAEKAYLLERSNFYCPDFNQKDSQRILFVKKSVADNYFFSHRANFSHIISGETLLHKSAIKWLLSQTEYELPGGGESIVIQLEKEKSVGEFNLIKGIRPDVKLTAINGSEYAVEIVVTNDISGNKQQLINNSGLKTIRVDLSEFYEAFKNECRTDLEFINFHLETLLRDKKLKSWVPNPNLIPESVESGNSSWLDAILATAAVGGIIYLLKMFSKPSRRMRF
ncbi:MAG: hypothetical protein V4717_21080 [Bacteroidota bacterium]